jgi:hypothetical protein
MIKTHNAIQGQTNPLSTGQTVKVVWLDGSSEQIKLNCKTSPACAAPVQGTQQLADTGGGDGGGYAGGGDAGGGGGLSGTPYENCMSGTTTGCVAVGESETQCQTFSVLECP